MVKRLKTVFIVNAVLAEGAWGGYLMPNTMELLEEPLNPYSLFQDLLTPVPARVDKTMSRMWISTYLLLMAFPHAQAISSVWAFDPKRFCVNGSLYLSEPT